VLPAFTCAALSDGPEDALDVAWTASEREFESEYVCPTSPRKETCWLIA
jgi:hypothetical protein